MINFSDFVNQNNDAYSNNQKSKDDTKLEELIDKYSKYDSNQIMSEFLKLTLEKKKKGELKKSELDNIKKTILPYLNKEQKIAMEKILEMVENV